MRTVTYGRQDCFSLHYYSVFVFKLVFRPIRVMGDVGLFGGRTPTALVGFGATPIGDSRERRPLGLAAQITARAVGVHKGVFWRALGGAHLRVGIPKWGRCLARGIDLAAPRAVQPSWLFAKRLFTRLAHKFIKKKKIFCIPLRVQK